MISENMDLQTKIDNFRAIKVAKLAMAARRCDITSDVLAQMNDEQWNQLEQVANPSLIGKRFRPASQTTRDETIKALRNAEAARARTKSVFPKF